jgi:hypothetical protein
MPLDEAAYVKSSRYRVAALRYLQSGPTNPSKIAEDEDEHLPMKNTKKLKKSWT